MKFPFEEPSPSFTIELVDISFQSWIDSPFLSEETRERLSHANVLLVPDKGHAGEGVYYFPQATIEFYDFLKRNKSDNLIIDACVEDDDYKELSLHSDILILAGLVVAQFVVPVVVNLVSDYISDRLKNRKEDAMVKAKLTVTLKDNKHSVEFDYYGLAKEYHEVMVDALSKIESLPNGAVTTLPEQIQANTFDVNEEITD